MITFQNRQLGEDEFIDETYDVKINANFGEIFVDLNELQTQLTEILNETDLDPNKDPEVTNARNSDPWNQTFATIKDRLDYTEEKIVNKNLIINSGFQVWQRGTSFAGLSSSSYTADRWEFRHVDSNVDVDRITTDGTEPFEADYYMRLTASVSSRTIIQQVIENIKKYNGSDLTLSFWVKGDVATTAQARLDNYLGSAIKTVNYNITTEWTKVILTFTNINLTTDEVELLPINSYGGLIVNVANFKLEVGEVATLYEHKTYAEELIDCLRYYYRLNPGASGVSTICNGHNFSTVGARLHIPFPIEMRSEPTFSNNGGFELLVASGAISVTLAPSTQSKQNARLSATGSGLIAGEGCILRFGNVAGSYLDFDAEL